MVNIVSFVTVRVAVSKETMFTIENQKALFSFG